MVDKRLQPRRPTGHTRHVGQFETLEARALLSDGPFPRIINGEEFDRSFPRIVNGRPTSGFAEVGKVGDRSGFYCTGTLIAEQYVLTAGHCAEDVSATAGRFAVGGTTYNTSRIFVHPAYNENRIGIDDSANDLAIFRLSTAVTTITPSPIFRDTPRVGDILTLVGFGAGGTGAGHDGSFGTKRMGTTPIDRVTPRRILWTFDDNTESNTAAGDSGGPAYLKVDGVFYVAGVTSGGSRSNAGIGDNSYDTRVDYYAAWIDSIIGDTTTPDPVPDPDPDPVADDHADEPGPDATAIDLAMDGSFHASGLLEQAGDRDVFRFVAPLRGSLTVSLTSVTDSLDTYLRVYDGAGQQFAFDDDAGPFTDSKLSLMVAAAQTYFISAGSYRDDDAGNYTIDVTLVVDDHAETFAEATPIEISSTSEGSAAGTIERAGDRDMFKILANRTGFVRIDLRGSTGELDTELSVYDARGRRIRFNDDSLDGTDSLVVVRVRIGRTYFVEASGFGESQGDYELTIVPTGFGRTWRVPYDSAVTPGITRSYGESEAALAWYRSELDATQPHAGLSALLRRAAGHRGYTTFPKK